MVHSELVNRHRRTGRVSLRALGAWMGLNGASEEVLGWSRGQRIGPLG